MTSRRDWVATLITNSAILVCGVATGIISARLLQPEGRGALAVVFLWPAVIAGVGCLSLNEGITYQIGREPGNVRAVRAAGLWVGVVLSLVLGIVTCGIVPMLLGPERGQYVDLAQTYAVLFMPLHFTAMNLLAVDQGQRVFMRFNAGRLLQPLVYLLALFMLWILGGVSVASVACANLAAIASVATLKAWQGRAGLLRMPGHDDVRPLLAVSLRFHSLNLVYALASGLDQMMVASMLHDEAIGLYVVSLTVASAGIGVIMQTFQSVIFPELSGIKDRATASRYLASSVRRAMFLMSAAALTLIIVIPWVVPILFGQQYLGSILPAQILVAAMVPKALRGVIGFGLRGMGQVRLATIGEVAASVSFIALGIPLLKAIGLAGVAIALLTANVVVGAVVLSCLAGKHGVPIRAYWGLEPRTALEIALWSRDLLGVLRPAGGGP